MSYYDEIKFETLIGKTMASIANDNDEKIVFTQDKTRTFPKRMATEMSRPVHNGFPHKTRWL